PILSGVVGGEVKYAFGAEEGADAVAEITESPGEAGGAVAVTAENEARINATVSNAATTDSSAMKGASGSAYGIVIASNKVSGKATARITGTDSVQNPVTAGAGIAVRARDDSGIWSNTKLVAESLVTSDGGAGFMQETVNDLLDADHDTSPEADGTKT